MNRSIFQFLSVGDYEVEYFSNTLKGSFPEFVFENLVVDEFLEIK